MSTDSSTEPWFLQSLLATSTITEVGLSTNDTGPLTAQDSISIDELLQHQSVILEYENTDRNRLTTFFNPTMDELRSSLLAWASRGFPSIDKIRTIELIVPETCSDGQKRTTPFYVEYILQDTIVNKLNLLNQKTIGMSFTYSWAGNSISLHISRN